MTATRRVYEDDDLVRRILGFLRLSELKPIATLEKAFHPFVIGLLWRSVDIWRLICISRSARSTVYEKAVRYINADYSAEDRHGEHVSRLTEQEFASLRQCCSGLLRYTQDALAAFHVPRWKIQCYHGGGGLIRHSYDTLVYIDDDFDPTSPPGPGPEPVWQGYQMICTAGLAFYRRQQSDTPALQKYIDWLLSGGVDPRVNRLRLHAFEFDLDTIRRILKARTRAGEQPITELISHNIAPFTADQFTIFGQQAGTGLERIELWHTWRQALDPLMSTLDLSRVVDTIKDGFPNLTVLHIHLAGCVGNDAPHDDVIPLSTRPYDGKLRKVSILLHEGQYFEEYGGEVPLLAMARNLACVGAPGCHYEILLLEGDGSTIEMWHHAKELRSLVMYFKSHPPHIQRHLRTVNFYTDLKMTNTRLDDLRALTFTREGRPIPPIVVRVREAYAKQRLMLRWCCKALITRSESLDLASKMPGEPWGSFDLGTDIVCWASDMRCRKVTQGSLRELENLAEELGWPVVDPEESGFNLGFGADSPEAYGVMSGQATELQSEVP